MKEDSHWINERWQNVDTFYRIKSVLHEEKTDFQHLQLVDSYEYGTMLLLDGIVQTTEKDEFIYHEMMVHVPMISHPEPTKVLIIGGGDGGILREVLKYPSVEKATMVEIDPHVIELCRKFLPGINGGAFEDGRTDLVISDGAAYVRQTNEKFDVVIVDSPDPVGPAKILFSQQFYNDIHRVINPEGIMVRQTGSLQMQAHEQRESYDLLKRIFAHAAFYVYTVPTYVGGLFSSIFCADSVDPILRPAGNIQEKFDRMAIETRYYNAGIHTGAFNIPQFLRKIYND